MTWGHHVPPGMSVRAVTPAGEAAAAGGFQSPQQPVEDLLDDDGDDVEEGVDAADTCQDEEEVAQPVRGRGVVLVDDPLAAHHVSETDGAEGHEAEVERVQVAPAFSCRVHERGTAGHQDGRDPENEHDAVDRRLPTGQILSFHSFTSPSTTCPVTLSDSPSILWEDSLVMAPLVAGLEDDCDDGDDALQKEVEEENGGGAAEQAVEHQEDFSSDGGRSGHPEP